MLVRKQRSHRFVSKKLGQKLTCHLRLEQPVAVLREHGRHPYWIIHAQTDEPTIEQIVMQLFHQLAFRADGACNKSARSSRSGAIDGRPSSA